MQMMLKNCYYFFQKKASNTAFHVGIRDKTVRKRKGYSNGVIIYDYNKKIYKIIFIKDF